jgi:hypothetical protein
MDALDLVARLDPFLYRNMITNPHYTTTARNTSRTKTRYLGTCRVDACPKFGDDLVRNSSIANAGRGVNVRQLLRDVSAPGSRR